jgi:dihydropteroate synthase-like protein
VIPGDSKRGFWPLSAEEKLKSLEENLRIAEKRIEKILIDPVLSPPWSTLESLIAYREASRKFEYPIMMGLSNVVELVDFDSPGVNSFLVQLAGEVGASVLMVTEQSDKCLDSWYEVKVASSMIAVAKKRGSLPKDLGVDMLIVKEKRREEVKFEEEGKELEVKDYHFPLERTVVKIWVDDEVKVTVQRGNEKYLLKGEPYLIGKTLIGEGLVKDPSHALYLGWELHKAFVARKLNKGYVQERPLKLQGSKEKWEELRGTKKR